MNHKETLQTLGLEEKDINEKVFDQNQNNMLYFIHLKKNNLWLELVEPVDQTSSIYTFANKFGMGLHHLAMQSKSLHFTEQEFQKQKGAFTIGRYKIKVDSFGGNIKTLFIAIKGLILEFVRVKNE